MNLPVEDESAVEDESSVEVVFVEVVPLELFC